jgi:hypothetical protein
MRIIKKKKPIRKFREAAKYGPPSKDFVKSLNAAHIYSRDGRWHFMDVNGVELHSFNKKGGAISFAVDRIKKTSSPKAGMQVALHERGGLIKVRDYNSLLHSHTFRVKRNNIGLCSKTHRVTNIIEKIKK